MLSGPRDFQQYFEILPIETECCTWHLPPGLRLPPFPRPALPAHPCTPLPSFLASSTCSPHVHLTPGVRTMRPSVLRWERSPDREEEVFSHPLPSRACFLRWLSRCLIADFTAQPSSRVMGSLLPCSHYGATSWTLPEPAASFGRLTLGEAVLSWKGNPKTLRCVGRQERRGELGRSRRGPQPFHSGKHAR